MMAADLSNCQAELVIQQIVYEIKIKINGITHGFELIKTNVVHKQDK